MGPDDPVYLAPNNVPEHGEEKYPKLQFLGAREVAEATSTAETQRRKGKTEKFLLGISDFRFSLCFLCVSASLRWMLNLIQFPFRQQPVELVGKKACRSDWLNAGGPPVSTPLLRRFSMKLRRSSACRMFSGCSVRRAG